MKVSEAAPRLLPLLSDTAWYVDEQIRAGKRVMLEGAQGTLLDLDHGSYPFVTSSSAVAGGACTGCGVGPSRIETVLGISKAYATRVGSGPFPSELFDEVGEHLCTVGKEFGSVTGRPRRSGWLDLAALNYARTVNGLDMLAITKLDVLTGLSMVRTAVGYETPEGFSERPPRDMTGVSVRYADHPGWSEDITGCRTLDALPKAARALLDHIEDFTQLPIALVSVGPRRDQTIMVREIG